MSKRQKVTMLGELNVSVNKMTNSAIAPLIEGHKAFKNRNFIETQNYKDLAKGQNPKVLVIACCDSRVDPAMIFGCDPGDLFVVRNVANLVPHYHNDHHHHSTSSALEFAVKGLNVSDIIVLGHSSCGGIQALMSGPDCTNETDFINDWMNIAIEAKERVIDAHPDDSPEQQAHHCEKESILISVHNLMDFPWIQERVVANKLNLHAWYFDIANGKLQNYDTEKDEFVGV